MIEMRMGQKDLVDALLYSQRQIPHPGSCIDEGVGIKQKTHGAMTGVYAARSAQYLDLHG